MKLCAKRGKRMLLGGFSLAEVMISMVIFMVTFLALYAGLSNGFFITKITREKLRSTQIITERFEAIRLFSWSNIMSNPNMSWTNSREYYDFSNSGGTVYNVNIALGNGPADVNYSNCLKVVLITVTWTNGNTIYTNQMASYVGWQGLQQYVY